MTRVVSFRRAALGWFTCVAGLCCGQMAWAAPEGPIDAAAARELTYTAAVLGAVAAMVVLMILLAAGRRGRGAVYRWGSFVAGFVGIAAGGWGVTVFWGTPWWWSASFAPLVVMGGALVVRTFTAPPRGLDPQPPA